MIPIIIVGDIMSVQVMTRDNYDWFEMAGAGEKILSLSLDSDCLWEWTHREDGTDPDPEDVGITHVAFNTYLNWKPAHKLYFRKVPRDFKDVVDEPSWYKIDKP